MSGRSPSLYCTLILIAMQGHQKNIKNKKQCMYVCMYGHTYSKRIDQPDKVASPARGQLNRKNEYLPVRVRAENFVSRDGFDSPVPRQPTHLHTQAESGVYLLRDSSRVPRRRPFIHLQPTYAIGSVPSLSGHAIACQWRSLPKVRRHGASKPPGSSERVLPWQVTMDQLIFAPLSHTHYWYKLGMLKVPAYLNGFPDGRNLGSTV